MYEFETHKATEIGGNSEKALHYLGRAMSIAEEMCGGETGYRNGMGGGMRGNYRGIGYRDDERIDEGERFDDWGNPIGMRRSRDSRGRFM